MARHGSIVFHDAVGTPTSACSTADLAVVSMIQLMGSPYPLRQELQALTYGALTELSDR